MMHKTICLLTVLLLICTSAFAQSTVYTHDGKVTLIDGSCVDTPVKSFTDAADVISAQLDQLGGDQTTQLEPWRDITDAFGNHYYVFQQMHNTTTVLGGAVKLITDGSGNMIGLTSSIVSEVPEEEQIEGISAEAAEQIVISHLEETIQRTMTPMAGLTQKMILPLTIRISNDSVDEEGSRYVWVVYTENPERSYIQSSELPYLAHYVTMAGEYLYSLPTIIPGDAAGMSGFASNYIFEFMEPVEYTGYVDMSVGGEQELTVTVMRDQRTGMYYLGNLERKIVVADCWEFLYDDGRVVLESSPDNLEWDQTGLISLYNYCRAYDYYKEIGWSGGDGLDTPILVLNNFCDKKHVPIDNAAYMGNYLGWQVFVASQGNDFSECLDVLAHEFTHCVTGSVMTYNAYQNDFGAINEAMSDIQGKTCQMLVEGRDKTSWIIADKSKNNGLRSMSEPHLSNQPEFTWDFYYKPLVELPTDFNDRGGVHTNSSLLNYLAWRLYEKAGMSLEEGRAFWFTVDCAMVPGTDYPQLAEILPWALRASGLVKYETELQQAIDATRLGVDAVPETFDDDHALLSLTLPQTGKFDDGQWVMFLWSLDVDKLMELSKNLISQVASGDYSGLPAFIQEMLMNGNEPQQVVKEEKGLLEAIAEALAAINDEEKEADTAEKDKPMSFEEMKSELIKWIRGNLVDILYASDTNGGQDGRTMRMVSKPGYALPVLMHGVNNAVTEEVEEMHILIYIGGGWFDLGRIMSEFREGTETQNSEVVEIPAVKRFIDNIGNIRSVNDFMDLLLFRIDGGKVNELPNMDLESLEPFDCSTSFTGMQDAVAAAEKPEPKKSRPKIEEEKEVENEAA
ncbi:MAG: M4 family metallopeptidase [Clostridia bacterium]|nr:M4 family metallopeptidase [Clostridia bacterium]